MATIEMIELECPSCGEELEIDAGFAGGVCRCSDCGTLMTVPEDPMGGHAESLSRPSRPDAPVRVDDDQRPRSNQPEKIRAGAPTPNVKTPGASTNTASDADRPAYASVASIELGSGEVLVTSSGREVKLGNDTVIPTAGKRRRPIVRFLTAAVFIAFMGVVVLGTVVALYMFFIREPNDPTDQIIIADPERNPYLEAGPTLMNVPLQNRVAIVLDGTRSSETWIGEASRGLQITLAKFGEGRQIKVFVVSEDGVIAYPRGDRYVEFGRQQRAQLQQIMDDEVFPFGTFDLPITLDRVLDSNPHQVILITGARIGPGEIERANAEIKLTEGAIPAIDGVPIGSEANSPDYKAFIQSVHGPRAGIYFPWDRSRLESWYEDWERAVGEQGYLRVFDLPEVDPLPPEEEPEPITPDILEGEGDTPANPAEQGETEPAPDTDETTEGDISPDAESTPVDLEPANAQ